ncbi:helix-turn-helix transcriptional regulator [Pectobacterium brasiliense]|uniref:helix-turn-helix transcriptional regulator n=1 Tax=Pectobacterium brasiliense TaxID=180957 RepID=UPI001F079AD6|nr:hypothetical protein [Pectobacterium brasiliense]
MLMSKAEYARHCGVSRQTVYDWVKKGEVILSGVKIDVTATEQKRDGDGSAYISPKAVEEPLGDETQETEPKYQPFSASDQEAADIVLTFDDIYPPASTYEELQTRILDAAEALNLEVRLLEVDDEHIRGIELYDADQDCVARRCDSHIFELEALTFLRWLVVEKKLGQLNAATKAGLAALSEPFITNAKAVYGDRMVE